MMIERKKLIAVAALAAAIAIMVFLFRPTSPSEPVYAGHTLTEWVQLELEYSRSGQLRQLPPTPEEAIRHIGTNAIAHLLRWITENESPPTRERVMGWVIGRLPKFLTPDNPDGWTGVEKRVSRYAAARLAFHTLGTEAVAAIPELESQAKASGNKGYIYLETLHSMGVRALPAFERLAQDTNALYHELAATYFQQLKTESGRTN